MIENQPHQWSTNVQRELTPHAPQEQPLQSPAQLAQVVHVLL
jgi:hypothetical protein